MEKGREKEEETKKEQEQEASKGIEPEKISKLRSVCEYICETVLSQADLVKVWFPNEQEMIQLAVAECRDKKLKGTQSWSTDVVLKIFYQLKQSEKLPEGVNKPQDLVPTQVKETM